MLYYAIMVYTMALCKVVCCQ